ncbi:MAG: aminoacyl-tRNA hydrolase [Candidatus Binatia bacterium]
MHVVVGLGNPGSIYAASRHNIGFVVVEELARRWRLVFDATRPECRVARGMVAGVPAMLVEPQTYMNLSGLALAGVEPPAMGSGLIVIHDDLDLELGCVRVKRGGGTAGHRGVASIIERLGSDFTRVRVGIGHPPCGQDAAAYVLSQFDAGTQGIVGTMTQRAADAVECILRAGEEAAMNIFNVRTSRETLAATTPLGRS